MLIIDLVAAMPLFAIKTLRITRFPPCAATYFASKSVAVVSGEISVGVTDAAALTETSRSLSGFVAVTRVALRVGPWTTGEALRPTDERSPKNPLRLTPARLAFLETYFALRGSAHDGKALSACISSVGAAAA